MTTRGSHVRAQALLLAFAHLILTIDFTIVYVALPSLGRELGFTQQTAQWAVHAYTLTFGGFLLLGGRATDRFERRGVLVGALLLFAIGSALGAFASGRAPVLVSRATQGIAAALIFPATLAFINGLFDDGPPRARALATWSLAGPAGLALGSVLGGLLVSLFGWRAVFLLNVPAAMAAAAAAIYLLSPAKSADLDGSFNLAGGLLITVATTALIFALVQGPEWGWGATPVMLGAGASVTLYALFMLHESRHAAPLVPGELLQAPALLKTMALTATFMSAFMTLSFVLTITFQNLLLYSAWATGLAFLVPCIAQAAGTQLSVPVVGRLGLRATMFVGFAIAAGGTTLLMASISEAGDFASLAPGLLLSFIGQGIAFAPMWAAVTYGVPARHHGIASAIAMTSFQIGGAVGMSLLLAASRSPLLGARSGSLNLSIAHNGVAGAAAMFIMAALITLKMDLAKAQPLAAAPRGQK